MGRRLADQLVHLQDRHHHRQHDQQHETAHHQDQAGSSSAVMAMARRSGRATGCARHGPAARAAGRSSRRCRSGAPAGWGIPSACPARSIARAPSRTRAEVVHGLAQHVIAQRAARGLQRGQQRHAAAAWTAWMRSAPRHANTKRRPAAGAARAMPAVARRRAQRSHTARRRHQRGAGDQAPFAHMSDSASITRVSMGSCCLAWLKPTCGTIAQQEHHDDHRHAGHHDGIDEGRHHLAAQRCVPRCSRQFSITCARSPDSSPAPISAIDLGKVARPGGQRRTAARPARTSSHAQQHRGDVLFSAWSSVALRAASSGRRAAQAGQLARQPGQVGVGQARAQPPNRRAPGRWTTAASRGRHWVAGAALGVDPCRARFFRARQSLRNERMACSWFRSVRRIARRAAFSKGFQAATLPLEYDRSVAVSPVYSDANSRFHTISRLRHTDMRQFAQLSLAVLLAASQIGRRLRSTGRQSCQPEFRGYRHSRRAARAVALHAAQLPGGPARQGQAHAGLGPSGGQQPGPVHADRRAAPAGLRHCRCGRRDPRGARSRRQARGSAVVGDPRPAARARRCRCPASRARAAARC